MAQEQDTVTARRTVGESVHAIKASMGDIRDSAGDIVAAERERLHDAIARGKERVREARSGFEDYVREQPVKALLIAAGAGALLGFLLGRKR